MTHVQLIVHVLQQKTACTVKTNHNKTHAVIIKILNLSDKQQQCMYKYYLI